MPSRCTCGAILPDDARFCHKCGKPQFEEDIARLSAEEVSPAPVPASPSAPAAPRPVSKISYKNSRAVWISLLVAAVAFVCSGAAVLVSPVLWPLVLIAAGFIAVLLYQGQSVEPLSTAGGARLGWMTGIWLFAVIALGSLCVALVLSSSAAGDLIKQLQATPQVAKLYQDPHEFLTALPFGLLQAFFLVTLLPGLGGILGAKLFTRRRPS